MINVSDPRQLLDRTAMTASQILVVVITILLNGMDGYDVASIAFASPGIAAEWGIERTALGVVLSMELAGMAFGAMIFGAIADKRGRRPTLLICLCIMAIGMMGATTVSNPFQLSVWRVFTGIGIGGMLSATNAVVAEFSNRRWRNLCISFMVIGYPLFGGIGGLVASGLLDGGDWRAVFYLGAGATAVMLPLVFLLVPESPQWLARKQPVNALPRLNSSLAKLGHAEVSALPEIEEEESKKSLSDIFSPALLGTTMIVTTAFFLHFMTFYFLLKWTPKIVADMGFADSDAGYVLTMANFGGAFGGALFGFLTARVGLKPLSIAILALNAAAIIIFGRTPADLDSLILLGMIAGFFGNAGISALYSLAAWAFPTHARGMGTGFVIGAGRGGAIVSPILAGYLLEAGSSLPTLGIVMGAGSLLGAVALLFLKGSRQQPTSIRESKTNNGIEPSVA